MKKSTVEQPRFTCRVVRGWMAIFGDDAGGIPRGPGSGHVGSCPDCQAFFGACDQLELALKRDAARGWRDAPAGLEQEIIRAVNRSVPAPARRETRGAWLSFAGAAACAVVAALVYQQRPVPAAPPARPPAQAVASATETEPAMLTVARQIIAAVPTDLFVQMKPQAQALLQQDPYSDEVEAVKSDARTVVRFLARNFLPTPSDEPTRSE